MHWVIREDRKNGGEDGIRTHGAVTPTPFPRVRLKPLSHLSVLSVICLKNGAQRGTRTPTPFGSGF
jgi:hypothetical protein